MRLRPRSPSRCERAKAPYKDSEIAAYVALAEAQPTPARAMRLSGLIALGAGAGLMGADLRAVRGSDVMARSGGVVVVVKGRRPRVVPVLARHHERLMTAASFAGEGYVTGGFSARRRNVTSGLVASVAGGTDLAAIDPGLRRRPGRLGHHLRCGRGAGLRRGGGGRRHRRGAGLGRRRLTISARAWREAVTSRGMSRTVVLTIGSREYKVKSSATEEELARLAETVNAKLAAVPGRAGPTQDLVLAALALAHDLEAEQRRALALERKSRDMLRRVLVRLDNVLELDEGSPR